MPDLRNNQYNGYNTQRRYSMKGRDTGVFRSGELVISSYRGSSCDITLNDLSIDCAIKLLALLRGGWCILTPLRAGGLTMTTRQIVTLTTLTIAGSLIRPKAESTTARVKL